MMTFLGPAPRQMSHEPDSCIAQSKKEIAKRTELLLQIATSGLKVEEEMEKHASELDFACVRLMEKRLEAAHRSISCACGLPAACLQARPSQAAAVSEFWLRCAAGNQWPNQHQSALSSCSSC